MTASEADAAEALWRRLTIPEKERRKLINDYRDAVLAGAAERIRARCAADKAAFPQHSNGRIGLLSAAQMIDPEGDGLG